MKTIRIRVNEENIALLDRMRQATGKSYEEQINDLVESFYGMPKELALEKAAFMDAWRK